MLFKPLRGGKIAMPDNSSPFVLIAGGGPTGLTAALELRRFGIPVRIVDEKEGPEGTSRAVGIQARTLEELELRGLAGELVRIGQHATGGNIYGEGKLLVHVDFTKIASSYNFLLFLSQNETDRVLRQALEAEGSAVEWGVKMIAFGQEPSGITATLEHSDGSTENVRPAYVIDAEGAHSIIRSTLGLQFKGKTLEESFILGDVHLSGDLPNSNFHIFSSELGFLGLFPMGGSHFRLVAGNPVNIAQTDAPTLEELQAIYDQRSHIPARLHQLTWSSFFHINSRMVKTLRAGRIFLAGDAAHIHSPAGAQGMNTGIQDAINLGWKLALVMRGIAPDALLDTYEQDRLPVMRSIVSRTEGLTDVIGGHSILRNFFIHFAPFIANADFVQENATAQISQIALNYRNSPLSDDLFGDGNLTAGDRMPDLIIRASSLDPKSSSNPQPSSAAQLSSGAPSSSDAQVASEAQAPSAVQSESDSQRMFSLLNPSRFTLLLANFPNSVASVSVASASLASDPAPAFAGPAFGDPAFAVSASDVTDSVTADSAASNSVGPASAVPAPATSDSATPTSAASESVASDSPASNLADTGSASSDPAAIRAKLFSAASDSPTSDPAVIRAKLFQASAPWRDLIDIFEISAPAGEAGKPFTERFGVKPSITLVRPDAYIGFRGGQSSVDAFTKYCNRWFSPAVQKQAA
jgi:2-polyprenyl-6-methoxyphenol hydroxylase-like FAD-dependent oxidoreductase